MADTKYTFSKANDFPGGAVNFDTLTEELAPWSSALPNPKTLVRIDSEDDVVDIWFSDPLTQQEEIDLSNFVANHDNTVTPEGEAVVLQSDGTVPASQIPTIIGFTIGGPLDVVDLPATDLAADIVHSTGTVSNLRARRFTQGSSGSTSIQLEVNGSPVAGATLTWTSVDSDYAERSTTFSPQAIIAGDRISFRITSSEVGAEDVVGVVF